MLFPKFKNFTIPQCTLLDIPSVSRFLSILILISIAFSILMPPSSCENTPQTVQSVSKLAYYLQVYNSINSFRARHVAPALKWNRTLNEVAESLAEQIVDFPDVNIDPEDYEGVNFYETEGLRPPPILVTSTWYNESLSFNFIAPQYTASSLNFTQMIWKSSTTVGIGTATINNKTVIIAKFYPVGNIKGRFRLNVIPIRR